ncbi:MAG: Maf family protein [Sphingomonadales bacterium]|nr:Maf family protein [Sphingomonadales bacterium]MDE2170830.1 Maf family protein [Sphingomonadales bacterium]
MSFPFVLASKSASRRAMLSAAGLTYDVQPADVDERAIEQALADVPPRMVALALADAKALAVSEKAGDALVLGSDSLVVVDGRRFDKPTSRENAAEHLRFFSGRQMELHSAAALARNGAILWSHAEVAKLAVRHLDEGFITRYLDAEWPDVAGCVGVFRVEGLGINLFTAMDGSHFTILGMPLLAVLDALRHQGVSL